MSFAWAFALVLLVVPVAVLASYVWSLRRRRKQAVVYSSVALLRSVVPRSSRWRRHVPAALLIASLAVLAVASARPHVSRDVPIARTSIVLAVDVSRSMCATDVDPNRLAVAQKASRDFVKHQASGTRTGLIVFAGTAQLVVPPTRDHGELLQAIDNLSTSFGTAIGSAMLKSLDALSTVNPDVAPVGDIGFGTDAPPAPASPPGAQGYVPDIVVLLTDGANTRGIAPLDAVPYAVARRVRIYTIGFGTTNPSQLACTAAQLGGDENSFGGFGRLDPGGAPGDFGGPGGSGGSFGLRRALRVDLPTLQEIADRTGGQSYTAENASQLGDVFDRLPRDVTVQKKRQEVTVWFAAIGALLAAAAVAASLRWSAYPH